MPDKKFYITTPIYYVNARPHIGHAYSTIAADVLARRHRLLGDRTFFLTGTDEHGQKVQRSAEAAGIPPQQFADEVSATFRNLWKRMGITNDDYIRTTDERHKLGVQKLWRELESRGFIYLSTYTGQYSVGEEMFVDGPPGTIGPDGKPTETVTEENYFFKLSEFQKPLLDFYAQNEDFISPAGVRNEVLSFVRGGAEYTPGALKDLSISRTTFDWGIPVPGNEKHVIYVWLDALSNYMTAIGYGAELRTDLTEAEKQQELQKFADLWPADIHLVGKEITRFHCVYWPAFLMAAGLPLPKRVVANGWLLFEESKMSKSRGNIVRTETILDAFGTLCPPAPTSSLLSFRSEAEESASNIPTPPTKQEQDLFASDVIRYFLLREIPFGQDGSFSFDALVQRYNSDLANGYGNLVSRTLSMIDKYYEGRIPPSAYGHIIEAVDFSNGIDRIGGNRESADEFLHKLISALNSNSFATILELIQQFIKRVDQFLSEEKPWKLNPEIPDELLKRNDVLYASADAVKNITFLLHPFMPNCTSNVWKQLGFQTKIEDTNQVPDMVNLKNLRWGGLQPGTKLGPLAPIFPRAPKELIQQMTDMEQNNAPKPAPSKLVDETISHTTPAPSDPTHPGAAPRTSSLPDANPAAAVAGSHAITTERPAAQSHTEATASGIFASTPKPESSYEAAPHITIDDFIKVDLRVAQILVAERIPKADKLLRLEVDLGNEKRQILSGIAEWYTPEELIGRRIVVIANLAPRKMRGLESHGMLLAASDGDNGKPILATFGEDIALGSRVR